MHCSCQHMILALALLCRPRSQLQQAAMRPVFAKLMLCTLAHIHMLFEMKVSSKAYGQWKHGYAACMLLWCLSPQGLWLRLWIVTAALIWEEGSAKMDRTSKKEPCYAVVDGRPVIRQACICPHFQRWDEGQRHHRDLLVNDLCWHATTVWQQPFSIMVTQWRHGTLNMQIMFSSKDEQIE